MRIFCLQCSGREDYAKLASQWRPIPGMCGLVGYAGAFSQERLSAALEKIAHRGPDDSGSWVDQTVQICLGHRRLSIIDLSSAAHQPMMSADGSVVLSYNGEIYNFRELRADLELKGYRFRSHSDTEVVLALYLTEGESMLARLNGIFAFALWDLRSETLLLARDAFGVKPLYYAQTPQGVAFASEMKALLTLAPDLARVSNLDARAIHRYLSFLWCPGEGTPLKSVRKLGPGEAIAVKHARIARRWSWYRLPAQRGVSADQGEASAVKGTAHYLRQAVQRQMVADVPVGAFLSGGLDSSAVVAFAREIDPKVQCFTIDLAGGQELGIAEDLAYARRVAQHLGVSLEVVRVEAAQMADDLATMVAQLDEPLADPAALNVLYISRLARERGVKVLLSGVGGDDLFAGYRRHRALEAERYWAWLPQIARAGLKRVAQKMDRRTALGRRVSKAFAAADLDAMQRMVHYFLWADSRTLMPLYTPAFREQLLGEPAEAPLVDFLSALPTDVAPIEQLLALEQRYFLSDHNLLYTDKMSMAAGVEVRVPFLDIDLVEFAARIPAQMKQRRATGKWVLKKAMAELLPADVIYRSKTGFGAPLRRWLSHELRHWMRDLLSPESIAYRGFFQSTAVQELISAHDRGLRDSAYTLFALMSVELWCRHYLDGGGSRIAHATA